MIIVEFLQTAVVAVLLGFLTLANGLANTIEPLFAPTDAPAAETGLARAPENAEKLGDTLPKLQSDQVAGGPIPKILLENAAYQKAAVGESTDSTTVTASTSESLTVEERVERSLVNVYCQYQRDGMVRTTTGTGFFIHENGVVLTNAHVAQFLLFESIDAVQDANCILRGGNPAKPLYEAELLYISPAWISQNADLIEAEDPSGTGERDYALLYVSEALGNTPLLTRFPALAIDTELLPRSTERAVVVAGGYPAQQLPNGGPETILSPRVASTTVGELYTFGSNYADVFTINGSAVGERGSSGGAVTRENGDAIGLIVTKGHVETEGAMSLRALTLSYIDRTIKEETGFSLNETISGDLERRSKVFQQALAPFLSRILTQNLD